LEAASSEFEQSKRLEYLALGFCHGGVNSEFGVWSIQQSGAWHWALPDTPFVYLARAPEEKSLRRIPGGARRNAGASDREIQR
jgi:hypothetical protein